MQDCSCSIDCLDAYNEVRIDATINNHHLFVTSLHAILELAQSPRVHVSGNEAPLLSRLAGVHHAYADARE